MANKSGIAIGLIAVVVIASGIGYYFLVYQPSQIPRLTLKNGTESKSYTLEEILGFIEKGNITLLNKTATIDGAVSQVEGFNPLELYELNGWDYVDQVEFSTKNGSKQVINASQFILGDTNYQSSAVGDTSMIVYRVNGTLLKELNSKFGDFALIGTTLTTDQKLFDVNTLTYVSDWMVAVKVNNEIKSYISAKNISSLSNGNYTSYTYGYNDTYTGKSWDNTTVNSGVTITNLTTIAGLTTENYNVSFISCDGWGSTWKYSKTNMETGNFNKKIENNTVLLSWEGKQTILADKANGNLVGFKEGPFRIMMPGNTRDRYAKWITEIRFMI
jgi:hypothetical protein